MSIVHFTRFRVTAGREPAVLEARQASLRACQGSEPELRRAYLVRLARRRRVARHRGVGCTAGHRGPR